MTKGILGYLQALKYIPRRWMIKNILITGLCSLLVLGLLFTLNYFLGDDLKDVIIGLFTSRELTGIWDKGLDWLSRILIWLLILFSFKYLILIIAGPFVSVISQKVKEEEGFSAPKVSNQGFVYSGYRGIQLALKNIVKEIILTVILLIIGFATGLIFITGPLIIAVQAYYLGYANMALVFEPHTTIKESKNLIHRNRGLALINGLGFLGLLIIPVLGLFLAPSYSIAAATRSAMPLLD